MHVPHFDTVLCPTGGRLILAARESLVGEDHSILHLQHEAAAVLTMTMVHVRALEMMINDPPYTKLTYMYC